MYNIGVKHITHAGRKELEIALSYYSAIQAFFKIILSTISRVTEL